MDFEQPTTVSPLPPPLPLLFKTNCYLFSFPRRVKEKGRQVFSPLLSAVCVCAQYAYFFLSFSRREIFREIALSGCSNLGPRQKAAEMMKKCFKGEEGWCKKGLFNGPCCCCFGEWRRRFYVIFLLLLRFLPVANCVFFHRLIDPAFLYREK